MTQDQPQTTETPPEPLAGPGTPPPEAPAEPSPRELELEAEVVKLKDQLLRAIAETENVRRRLEVQADERGKYAVASFAKDILQVADNLHRAMESIPAEARANDPMAHKLAEGVELTERTFLNTLERYGIKRILSLGQRFDPHLHQAMMEIEDAAKPAGTVVVEMQAGYVIQDRLLREAIVGVSKGGPKTQPGDAGIDTSV